VDFDPSDGAPLSIALERARIIEAHPDPAMLRRASDGRFSLDVETSTLTLTRPGEADVEASWDGEAWSVDIDGLTPGPWSLVTDLGVAPRSIFAEELDERVGIDHVALLDTERWLITGDGFGRGTQAWAITGQERAYVALHVDVRDAERLWVQHALMAAADSPIDLVILSNGRQLVLPKVWPTETSDTGDTGDLPTDTGAASNSDTAAQNDTGPTLDTAPPAAEDGDSTPKLTTCACATSRDYPGPWLLVSLCVWFSRRRHR